MTSVRFFNGEVGDPGLGDIIVMESLERMYSGLLRADSAADCEHES